MAVGSQPVRHVVDVDHIGTATGIQNGRTRKSCRGVVDRECVAASAKRNLQSLDGLISDAAGHPQPRNRRGSQRAGVCRVVGGVGHVQLVAAASVTVDGQQATDAVQVAAAADIEGVGIVATVERRRTADGLHVEDVAAAVAVDVRRGADTRTIDGDRIAARAQPEIHGLDGAVSNAAGHSQAGQCRRRQRARVGRAFAGFVQT